MNNFHDTPLENELRQERDKALATLNQLLALLSEEELIRIRKRAEMAEDHELWGFLNAKITMRKAKNEPSLESK
jgi:hypothetical protein